MKLLIIEGGIHGRAHNCGVVAKKLVGKRGLSIAEISKKLG